MKRNLSISIIVLLMILVSSCSQKPAEIHYGSDECAHCRMIITDNRFASQMVTETGKTIKFDAIECMAVYAGDHKSEMHSAKLWVSDFISPGDWVNVETANIIESSVIKSPMGGSLLAIDSPEDVKDHLKEYPGEVTDWQQIVK